MKKKNTFFTSKRSLSFRLLYFWAQFTGINPLTLSDHNQLHFSYFSMIYAILMIFGSAYSYFRLLFLRLELFLPGDSPIAIIAGTIGFVGELFEVINSWLIFGFFQNRVKSIAKSFRRIDETSTKLKISDDHQKRLRNLAAYLTVTPAVFLTWFIITSGAKMSGIHFQTFLVISYFFSKVTIINRWAMFVWILLFARKQFQRLNNQLRVIVSSDHENETRIKRGSSTLTRNSNCDPVFLAERITLMMQLHRELRDAIYHTVQHVAGCILLNILTQQLGLAIGGHIAYRFLRERKQFSDPNFFYFATVVSWIFIPVGMLVVISNVCGSTSEEANRTANILHDVLNNIDDFGKSKKIANLTLFSLELLHNHLRISLLGFCDLDYYLVYKVLTTVITLLTIMFQFYN